MLFSLFLGVVEPGACGLIRQPIFSLSDVADEGAELGATPTGDRGGGTGKDELFTAAALGGIVKFVPEPFKLVGRRPTNISNVWNPSGLNTWTMYGNGLMS